MRPRRVGVPSQADLNLRAITWEEVYSLPDGPAPPTTEDRDHVGVHEQGDGKRYVG